MDGSAGRLAGIASPRRVYGVGLFVLGVGNLAWGLGQLLGGPQLAELSLVQLVMGVTLAVIGGLVVADSDRLSTPDLSSRTLLAIGVVGALAGLYMLLGGVVLLSG